MDYIAPPSTLPPGANVWAYLRDSGGNAQEQSVSQQRDEISEYCNKYGLILVWVYFDIAKSGGSTKGRDQFQKMIDDAMNPTTRPAGLLVWSLSRLSRDIDDSAFYKALLRRCNIVIHSLTDNIPEGLAGRIVESVQDYSNADFRVQLSKAITRGIRTNVQNGYAPGGFPPNGYISEAVIIGKKRDGSPRKVSRWIPDPDKFDLAKIAWQLRSEGKPYAEITKATGGKLYKTVNSWATFFANRSYLGIAKCGNQEYPNHHEAACTLEQWEKVQKLRRDNTGRFTGLSHPRRIKYPSLFSGIAFCIYCGAAIIHHREYARNKPRYVCGFKERRHGLNDACSARVIRAAPAEAAILDAVISRVLTPSYMEELIEETRLLLTNTDSIVEKIKDKRQQVHKIKMAINNLLELAETFGAISAQERLKQRETELAVLNGEIKNLEAQQQQAEIEIAPEALAIVLQVWRGELKDLQAAGDVSSMRSFLSRFVTKIELGRREARIWYSYPIDQFKPMAISLFRGTQ